MLPWKLRKCQILPVNQNLSSVYFSLAKFQLVRCNPSPAMIWQMTCTHKLPKLCSATLRPDYGLLWAFKSIRGGHNFHTVPIRLRSSIPQLWLLRHQRMLSLLPQWRYQRRHYCITSIALPRGERSRWQGILIV